MSDRERAKIKISLVSKGARSSLEGFVTPEQWGQIVATVNGQPAQATPVGPVAWANSKEFHDALARGQSFNGWRKKYSDCDMALFTTPLASVEPVARLTDAEIEQGRQEIFSVNNPYCPCDIKTMQKAVRWAERTIAARDTTPPASVEPDKKDAEWQPTESMPEGWGSQNFVERLGDMSPLGRLRVAFDNDGDVIVAIVPDPNSYDTGGSVEFCTTGFGGGGSPHTRNACIALFKAMERDNESNRARCGLIGRGAAIAAAIAEQEPNK